MQYDREYFKGKTVVVTGAASGIGLALAEELLASDAAKVVLADNNPDNLHKEEARLLGQYGERVKGIVCDVTVEDAVRRLIAESVAFFGNCFDLLFNNAGKGFIGSFSELSNEDWKTAFDLNFYGALYGMRAALPIMVSQGSGQIINIISGIAFMPMPYQARYAASKAALNALALALRSEYWDDNIKISSATPGTTATAIWGDCGAPPTAQTAEQAARRILRGVVNNDRIIFGDDGDVMGGMYCAHPEAQEKNDSYLLNVARERRKGNPIV